MAPLILNLASRRMRVVNLTIRPGKNPGTHGMGGEVGPRAGLNVMAKIKISCPYGASTSGLCSP